MLPLLLWRLFRHAHTRYRLGTHTHTRSHTQFIFSFFSFFEFLAFLLLRFKMLPLLRCFSFCVSFAKVHLPPQLNPRPTPTIASQISARDGPGLPSLLLPLPLHPWCGWSRTRFSRLLHFPLGLLLLSVEPAADEEALQCRPSSLQLPPFPPLPPPLLVLVSAVPESQKKRRRI